MMTDLSGFRAPTAILLALMTSVSALSGPAALHAQTTVAAAEAKETVASVTVAKVALADMVGQVYISGTLVPKEEILVYPLVSGSTIETLLVDVGDKIKAGQVLATLNDSTLTAQLAQARAEYARAVASVSQARNQIASAKAGQTQAETEFDRATVLRRNGSGTQAALDQATANKQTAASAVASAQDGLAVTEAQQQQAQASLDIATLNLERATLRAPADGLISTRNGQVGAIAASGGEPIFRMIRDGLIEVEAEVIETALGTIITGNPARVRIAGNGVVDGVVRRISPTVDARNRLGTIRIEIENTGNLRTGVFASGEITTVERRSLAVPTTAVLTDNGGTFVLVVADNRLEKRPVVAGLIWSDLREVTDGLTADEVVVARAGAFYADGDKVNPIWPDVVLAEGVTK